MIVDYKLHPKFLPSDRQIFLTSKKAEESGLVVTKAIMAGLDRGEVKYLDGKFYKLCRHCLDYKEVDAFYINSRYVLGVGYICKDCVATRRRIAKYGIVSYVTDNKMLTPMGTADFNVTEATTKLIEGGLEKNGITPKDD